MNTKKLRDFKGYVYFEENYAKINFLGIEDNFDLIEPIREEIQLGIPKQPIDLYNHSQDGDVFLDPTQKIDYELELNFEINLKLNKVSNEKKGIRVINHLWAELFEPLLLSGHPIYISARSSSLVYSDIVSPQPRCFTQFFRRAD
ncbi:hypothetical protein DFA_11368 [Cavenderia fasciculata]|uniref:Uncharacterized protein n=1 Tax=Cavenderia fasciculata TaxID=261658 RepID=F4QCH2_CACFS|nr:uncharacterized protein DFA_11368 [Cavenderia fasciculata]EGG13607.1 hypothetical protein DFA_11368 [Cavenderia fasciculata]|eukprot:XP_004350311.1 hypothetical protein DFA_11368 [Cavenderia fasciculata]